jgi:hypothetical protein
MSLARSGLLPLPLVRRNILIGSPVGFPGGWVLRAWAWRVLDCGIPPIGSRTDRAGQIGRAVRCRLVDRGARRGHILARPDIGEFLPFLDAGSLEVGAAGSARCSQTRTNAPFLADCRKPARLIDGARWQLGIGVDAIEPARIGGEAADGVAPLFGSRAVPMPVASAPTRISERKAPSRLNDDDQVRKNRRFFKPKTGSGVARQWDVRMSVREMRTRRAPAQRGARTVMIEGNRGHRQRLGGVRGRVN